MMRALLFDICDTLVRTAGVPGLLKLPGLEGRYCAGDIERFFVESEVFRAYERGEVSTDAFFTAFCGRFKLEIDREQLQRAYEGLILHQIEGVAEWVRGLAAQYPLYALSNNNPLLWRGTQRVCTVLDCFEQVFLSHYIGLLKPDARAFLHALEQMDCAVAEVVLIDDNPRCVQAARALGMGAVLFEDAQGAARAVAKMEIVKKLA